MTKESKRRAFVFLAILLFASRQVMYYVGEVSASDGFAGGSGTENDPYLIKTAEHLDNVKSHLDAHFKLTEDINLSEYSGKKGWEPIGDNKNRFEGVLNGSGHKIQKLTINRPETNVIGLFGILGKTAIVRDITMEAVNISGGNGVGGLAGGGAADIERVTIRGKIKGKGAVGGLLGGIIERDVDIKDSHFVGKITGDEWVGGICGITSEFFGPELNPTFTNCSVQGEIIGQKNVGGLIGVNTGLIANCRFKGYVDGKDGVGGLVGSSNGNITDSYAEGEVRGGGNAGGLLGMNEGGDVKGSFFSGKVSSEFVAGGLVGGSKGNIKSSYATGEISVEEAVAGGLVGLNAGNIKDSYVIGNVRGREVTGGLLGANEGEVYNSYAGCQVSGEKEIGGLVGRDKGKVISCYYDKEIASRNDTGKGRPKSTEEMMQQKTFLDWDFWETWSIAEGESYPYLQWAENDLPIPPEKKYHLLIRIRGNGETDPDAGFHLYPVEGNVEVTASPGENWKFSHWELNGEPAGEDPSIIVEAAAQSEMLTIVAYFDGFAGGAGTEEDPYLVETAHQLDNIRYLLRSSYKQIADIDLGDYSEEKGWEPIGDGNNGFEGTFDGNGHEITNLTIKRAGADNVGLFGTLGKGKTLIKNVSLKNVDVSGNRNVGGLVGNNRSNKVKIANSNVSGNIRGKSSIGALLGTNTGEVNRNYALGTVTGEVDVGGLIGMNRGNLENSYAEVDVKGKRYAGGLAGRNRGVIKNCYATGTVMGEYAVGGLVGKYVSSLELPQHLNDIFRCYAVGKVEGEKNTGGLIGEVHEKKEVRSCYYNKESTGQEDSIAGSIPKSTKEMLQEATFEGWDFEDVWAIDENESYPHLQWQVNEKDQ